jgi:hypothetical protein
MSPTVVSHRGGIEQVVSFHLDDDESALGNCLLLLCADENSAPLSHSIMSCIREKFGEKIRPA